MKKLLIVFSSLIVIFLFVNCGGKDKDEETPTTEVKVKYAASCNDPVNYQLRVSYMNENGSPLQVVIVDSPWSYEMTIKNDGTYLYLSVLTVLKDGGIANANKMITAQMFIDDKLYKEDQSSGAAAVQDVYKFNQ